MWGLALKTTPKDPFPQYLLIFCVFCIMYPDPICLPGPHFCPLPMQPPPKQNKI